MKKNVPVTRQQILELEKGKILSPEYPNRAERRLEMNKKRFMPFRNNRKRTTARLKKVWPGIPNWMKYSNRRVYP